MKNINNSLLQNSDIKFLFDEIISLIENHKKKDSNLKKDLTSLHDKISILENLLIDKT